MNSQNQAPADKPIGRAKYLILVAATIASGIISRQVSSIPLFIGDVLYAVMIYFASRFIFFRFKPHVAASLALIFCILIECMQLHQAKWIVEVRNTPLGHYVLGQGFRWSDLLAYTIGIASFFSIDRKYIC